MERSKKELDHHITSLTGIHSKNSRFYWEAVVYFLELKSKVDEEKDRQVKTAMGKRRASGMTETDNSA